MFGGLTKTSSRIAIAAVLGLTLGGFAFKATPAQAADLGGDCCADLEERVAELEATTVRKGNKKVSVTLSGWVVKSMNAWWDDGDESSAIVGDKDYDLGTRFAITGSGQIAPGWSGGFQPDDTRYLRFVRHVRDAGQFKPVRRERQHVLRPPAQPALLVYLHQERHAGRPELGSLEPCRQTTRRFSPTSPAP